MPTISMFYGILVSMYFIDTGEFPKNKQRLVQAWIEIHAEELMADWKLAIEGRELFRIDPLK